MATLYLLETRAAKTYECSACGAAILRGTMHFRHDPHPMARRHRGERYTHWCQDVFCSQNQAPNSRSLSVCLCGEMQFARLMELTSASYLCLTRYELSVSELVAAYRSGFQIVQRWSIVCLQKNSRSSSVSGCMQWALSLGELETPFRLMAELMSYSGHAESLPSLSSVLRR